MDHPGLLAEINTWVGVGIAWVGLIVIYPRGTQLLLAACGGWLRRLVSRVRTLVWRSRRSEVPLQVRATSATAFGGGFARASGRGWPAKGSVEERIEALRRHITDVERRVRSLTQEVLQGFNELRTAAAQLEHATNEEHARLRSHIDADSRESARIDARGLPVIGVGILLTAAPEQLASVPWLGWVVLILGIAVAAAAVIHAWRHHRSGVAKGSLSEPGA